jgi:hypothetical protein
MKKIWVALASVLVLAVLETLAAGSASADLFTPEHSFIIKDGSGEVIAYFDSEGNFFTACEIETGAASADLEPEDGVSEFVVVGDEGECVARLDPEDGERGVLYLKGSLVENSPDTGPSGPALIIDGFTGARSGMRSSSAAAAWWDNYGRLTLKALRHLGKAIVTYNAQDLFWSAAREELPRLRNSWPRIGYKTWKKPHWGFLIDPPTKDWYQGNLKKFDVAVIVAHGGSNQWRTWFMSADSVTIYACYNGGYNVKDWVADQGRNYIFADVATCSSGTEYAGPLWLDAFGAKAVLGWDGDVFIPHVEYFEEYFWETWVKLMSVQAAADNAQEMFEDQHPDILHQYAPGPVPEPVVHGDKNLLIY